ncbi:MAG: hypothetical protein IJJ60_08925 [Clostridia bacterium]|nr:hypothetical protein [Clostridia bacterium]
MTADAVFLFQKILRRLRRGMGSVKSRDPQLATLKPAASPQGMIYFIVGKNKRGGLFTLRAHIRQNFDPLPLFSFGWEQGSLFHRFLYA